MCRVAPSLSLDRGEVPLRRNPRTHSTPICRNSRPSAPAGPGSKRPPITPPSADSSMPTVRRLNPACAASSTSKTPAQAFPMAASSHLTSSGRRKAPPPQVWGTRAGTGRRPRLFPFHLPFLLPGIGVGDCPTSANKTLHLRKQDPPIPRLACVIPPHQFARSLHTSLRDLRIPVCVIPANYTENTQRRLREDSERTSYAREALFAFGFLRETPNPHPPRFSPTPPELGAGGRFSTPLDILPHNAL